MGPISIMGQTPIVIRSCTASAPSTPSWDPAKGTSNLNKIKALTWERLLEISKCLFFSPEFWF